MVFPLCQKKGDALKREKTLCALESYIVAEKGKGVRVITKVLHQAGCIHKAEVCETVNLVHPSSS